MLSAFDPEEVLRLPLMAILSSVAADGSPRNAPVWFQWDGTAIWMLSQEDASSALRVAADRRVSVEIVEYDNPGGVLRHHGLRGRATIEPSDADLFRALLRRCLGPELAWNCWFIHEVVRIDDPAGRMTRLEPESIFTNDVSFFRTGPRLARRERSTT